MKLSGWGRYPKIEATVHTPRSSSEVVDLVRHSGAIARGNGRAYGDSAISARNTIHMKRFNRILSFDETSGQVVAEAGVILGDIIDAFLPRGWFPAVTPGTKYVTVGGMIAADVHGKNHHRDGSFGAFVDWVEIVGATGEIERCSRQENPDLFAWTLGGMGLTGVILRAAFRLRRVQSAWIRQRTIVADNVAHAIDLMEDALDAPYSVAWIDCLQANPNKQGRSLIMLGDHAEVDELSAQQCMQPFDIPTKRRIKIPMDFPLWALNGLTVRAFNALYYWAGKRKARECLVDWDSYFYPLDALLGWNRIYGRHGFAQFQCVIPIGAAKKGVGALLAAISRAGTGSFLAVLKRFGEQESNFSFPMAGYTLALDFPITKKTLKLMEKLDDITLEHGGRFYLAKDSRMSRAVFWQSEKRAEAFAKYRADMEDSATFKSAQSERLGL